MEEIVSQRLQIILNFFKWDMPSVETVHSNFGFYQLDLLFR
jgi:hypothetical protein